MTADQYMCLVAVYAALVGLVSQLLVDRLPSLLQLHLKEKVGMIPYNKTTIYYKKKSRLTVLYEKKLFATSPAHCSSDELLHLSVESNLLGERNLPHHIVCLLSLYMCLCVDMGSHRVYVKIKVSKGLLKKKPTT